eukprot:7028223-Prymnesium_polylepis.1
MSRAVQLRPNAPKRRPPDRRGGLWQTPKGGHTSAGGKACNHQAIIRFDSAGGARDRLEIVRDAIIKHLSSTHQALIRFDSAGGARDRLEIVRDAIIKQSSSNHQAIIRFDSAGGARDRLEIVRDAIIKHSSSTHQALIKGRLGWRRTGLA